MITDKIKGSLLGGAIGDALGYPVEFLNYGYICTRYGEKGITAFDPERYSGLAVVSDDTQMTMFTAAGMLSYYANLLSETDPGKLQTFVYWAYQDWLVTQEHDYRNASYSKDTPHTWLINVPELYARRAPGNTCLSALEYAYQYPNKEDFISYPRNNSKGCGGVMRVAPIGLCNPEKLSVEELDLLGAEVAAITHSHVLGYAPAAVLVHIVNRIVYGSKRPLCEIVNEAADTVCRLFNNCPEVFKLKELIDFAAELAQNDSDDVANIHNLGGGWCADEALAISIYCSLKYEHDYSAGIIAAVNHDGDSDSTGAITGNILGAICGHNAIDEKWKERLELHDELCILADDMCRSVSGSCEISTSDWTTKYLKAEFEHVPQ